MYSNMLIGPSSLNIPVYVIMFGDDTIVADRDNAVVLFRNEKDAKAFMTSRNVPDTAKIRKTYIVNGMLRHPSEVTTH